MNLRHIDDMFERHSAGWNPFKGNFRISKSSFRNNPLDALFGRNSDIGKFYRGFSNFGGQVGDKMGIHTQATDARNQAEADATAAARKAAHDTEVARLSQNALGAVAMRRRKGMMYASMFTGTPALSAPSTGKTLLSQ